jgi:dipeptidyl aminopeptidase/acylaminoacyl peptidase
MSKVENIIRRPIVGEDLRDLAALSTVSFSADGQYIAYVTTAVDWEEDSHKDFISIVEVATGQELVRWEGSGPQWSPVTNEIAYLCKYKGQDYIWIYSMPGDSKKSIVPVYESHYFMGHLSLKTFAWSPNGQQIAYISTKEFMPAEVEPGSVQVIDRLLYKTKGGRGRPSITDNRSSHIWVVAAKGGEPQLVTDSAFNEHSLCWSPDSNRIAFVSNRSADPDNNQLHDLWSIDLLNFKTSRHTENFGTVFQPAWSPDGNYISFMATRGMIATNDSPAEDTQLYILSLAENNIDCLTRSFDRRVEQIAWHPSGEVIYFTAGNHGTTPIYCVTLNGGSVEHVTGERCHIHGYSISTNGDRISFISNDPTHLTEVFIYNLSNQTSRQITDNSKVLQDKCLQDAESFWCESFDGTQIQGWIVKPANFVGTKTYPLVLVIHGGPHNMFGFGFEDRMQLLSSAGYGVLYVNPRGSSGYGQAFSNGTLLNWGGGDYKDLMSALDAAIQQNDWIDAQRLGVTGQSYGGFMTNWMITQTNRFKAAVSDGGISNLVSFAGTSLYHSLMEAEFNGSVYDNFALLWEWSPLRNVKNVRTPTLILHGALDNEVPVSQAEEMFIALKKMGVDTTLVHYTEEGHGWRPDLRPHNRFDLLSRSLAWFDKYLAKQ